MVVVVVVVCFVVCLCASLCACDIVCICILCVSGGGGIDIGGAMYLMLNAQSHTKGHIRVS